MRPKNYADEGVVLSRKNFGEADRVITIFTKNNGKVSFVAKGIRNIKSRKKGHLEVFSNIKLSSVTGNGMDIITEAYTIHNFGRIRQDLKKTAVAYYLLETIHKITHDTEKNHELYTLLVDALKKLDSDERATDVKNNFTKEVLVLLGFWPSHLPMHHPDQILEDVIERKLNSSRIGKKLIA